MPLFDTNRLYRFEPTGNQCFHCGTVKGTAHPNNPDGSPCPVAVLEAMTLYVDVSTQSDDHDGWDPETIGAENLADARVQMERWVTLRTATPKDNNPSLDGIRFSVSYEDFDPDAYRKIRDAFDAQVLAARTAHREQAAADARAERIASLKKALRALDRLQSDLVAGAYDRRRIRILKRYADVAEAIGEKVPNDATPF